MKPLSERYDAIIAGAGPTGLTMALALAHVFGGDARLALIDAQPEGAGAPQSDEGDPRAWALSAASVRLLDALGVWRHIKTEVQPVIDIEITDSALEAGIRPVLVSYDNHTADGEPAAYVVPIGVLLKSLRAEAARYPGITFIRGRRISGYQSTTAGTIAYLEGDNSISADLIIAADGRGSALRKMAGIKSIEWRYDQTGIVTTVAHDRPHGGKAVQHFLPGGPFAMLPLTGNRCCITWSENSSRAREIMALDDTSFLNEVQQRFGGKLGLLTLAGRRASFPLGMNLARNFVASRFALIGDAAHGVHPIAGQGLNLALRDIAALAECVESSVRSGLDFGDRAALERYQAWRRFDATLSAGAFDALNRLFSNDITLLRSAREVGLGLVDRLPDLKRFFVAEAAGLTGDLPELMRR